MNAACLRSGLPGFSPSLFALRRCMMTQTKGLDLHGVFSPITTPFDAGEAIAWDRLDDNIRKWNATPLRGYLVQGSNGEYCYLTVSERVEMIRKVRESASADKLVLAGSGCESTAQTVELTRRMAEAGADAAVVVTPNYFKAAMTDDALVEYYSRVADASPIPIVLYSVPANTGLDLSVAAVTRLSAHPNIIGMKDSGGDVAKMGRMVLATRSRGFQLLAGSAGFLLGALHVGAVGGICALANAVPQHVCQLQSLFEQRLHSEASELQLRLIAPNAAVTREFGVPGLKAAMEWFGYYGGPTRSPLLPPKKDVLDNIWKTFATAALVDDKSPNKPK